LTKTLTVEGDVNTADTRTGLTAQGSVTAPSMKVPEGVSKIDKIIAAVAHDAAADGSAVWILRLGGSAVQKGEQVIVLAAGGCIAVQAGSDRAPSVCQTFVLEDVDIDVIPDIITVDAEMDGSDLGDSTIIVTLIFA